MLSLLNFSQLMSNMAAAVQGSSSALINLAVGSVLRALLEAYASTAMWMQWLIWLVLQQTRAATSTGTALDSWMADYGVTRLAGSYAVGTVTVARFTSTSSALVPVGAVFLTSDGTQSFAVTTNASNSFWNGSGYTIPAGTSSASLPVQAVTIGTGGNVAANTVTLLGQAISGIDTVNNPAPMMGGSGSETDAALRTRFQLYINTRSLATLQAIQYAVSSVSGVVGYSVIQNYDANGTYDPGSFYVVVDDGTGNPSSTLIANVLTAVSNTAGCGIRYSVTGPTIVYVTVSMALTVTSGASLSGLDASVNSALVSYIDSLSIGATMAYSKLASIAYGVSPNITNVSSVLLNGGTSDVTPGATQVIKASTVTVA